MKNYCMSSRDSPELEIGLPLLDNVPINRTKIGKLKKLHNKEIHVYSVHLERLIKMTELTIKRV